MKARIDELASLMQEYGLANARLKGEDWEIAFAKEPPTRGVTVASGSAPSAPATAPAPPPAKGAVGTPISSPMMGIYYSSPSPGSPPFVKEGDTITTGQVVGLIEAMKVFNEITATISGTVSEVVAESGALVQAGDVLIYVA
ncbi:MAG: acetyl-CoA carboxylase biotin carboxyl carrier protein subunit [Fimbriimonadaceae bacterium]|nr:acetyl-CoA carboxylase biotin carboxyl carrier protein subunit [Fimbriimonadaceae bacterium]